MTVFIYWALNFPDNVEAFIAADYGDADYSSGNSGLFKFIGCFVQRCPGSNRVVNEEDVIVYSYDIV